MADPFVNLACVVAKRASKTGRACGLVGGRDYKHIDAYLQLAKDENWRLVS